MFGLRQLIFMALWFSHYRSTNDGLFYKLNEQHACHRGNSPNEKKTGNQIVATNNKTKYFNVTSLTTLAASLSIPMGGGFLYLKNGFIMKS